jgi:hypothetical protein
MTAVALRFNSISHLVQVIKALNTINTFLDYDAIDHISEQEIVDSEFGDLIKQLMKEHNTELVEYVFNDLSRTDNLALAAMMYMFYKKNKSETITEINNFKLLISVMVAKNIDITDPLYSIDDTIIKYYARHPMPELTDLIISHINNFKNHFNSFKFEEIVSRINRQDFNNKVEKFRDVSKWMKAYDKAAKQRAIEVSFGLGYAQFDKADRDGNEPIYNQVQSTIPSLVLREIVNQSADLSGMPAQDVYQIVKHINEGITNKTIRLDLPNNEFYDALDDDVIEI